MTRECTDCHASFVLGEGELRFYAARGMTELPRRCPACRDAKKRRLRARYGDARLPMHDEHERAAAAVAVPTVANEDQATPTCASCGMPADVAFKPAALRPVYCRACYNWRQAAGSAGPRGGQGSSWRA